MRLFLPTLALTALTLTAPALNAARPLITDDARLTTARSCQLETWMRSYDNHREAWALPACNPTGNFEITAGVGQVISGTMRDSTDLMVQAKTLLRPLKTNNWGIGLAAGVMHHNNVSAGPNGFGNVYAYVPISASLLDDKFILHTNLGWIKSRGDSHALSWGLGSETRITSRLTFIAEAYGDPRYGPYGQLGTRYFIVRDKVQIDATIGQQANHGPKTRWLSLGLRLTPASLF
jgi:hypothetical protein